MTMPGFNAEASIYRSNQAYRSVPASTQASIGEALVQPRIVPQACPVGVLAVCSFWTQSCWAGGCWAVRLFGGPRACTSCMAGCLGAINPPMFGLCITCATPGTGFNVCS
jgi:hypothetical protein